MGSNGWGVGVGFRVCHVREAEWGPCSLREETSVMRGKLMFLHGFVWNDFLVSGIDLNRRVVKPVRFRNGKSEGGGVAAVKSQINSGSFCLLEVLGLGWFSS
jgi:hypothetical protein